MRLTNFFSVRRTRQVRMSLAFSYYPSWFVQAFFLSGAPGAFLPENLQRSSGPVENIAFRPDDVGHALRITRTRKTAFAIAGVLPKMPVTPRRDGPRPSTIVGKPQPAVPQYLLVRWTYP